MEYQQEVWRILKSSTVSCARENRFVMGAVSYLSGTFRTDDQCRTADQEPKGLSESKAQLTFYL
jgi:hypothetical protein